MRTRYLLIVCVLVFSTTVSSAGFLDKVMKGIGASTKEKTLDSDTMVSSLKEALSVGTENAVKSVSQLDGYFGNEIIKILMPEKIQKVATTLKKVGFGKQVDAFVLSMNRAAENAAPKAASFFGDSIREMTFEDAKGIIEGGDTAATDYFETKTKTSFVYSTPIALFTASWRSFLTEYLLSSPATF